MRAWKWRVKGSPAGWWSHTQYLGWLAEDEPQAKVMRFDRMSKSWAFGGSAFRQALVEEEVLADSKSAA
ncbi:MAG: hypothetical protein EA425_17495 [Puniceicoccaceae bacterium]|nr:MAG: hypothetical protein EA425_17495 [Puniceicoccaceae bacterium]